MDMEHNKHRDCRHST